MGRIHCRITTSRIGEILDKLKRELLEIKAEIESKLEETKALSTALQKKGIVSRQEIDAEMLEK